MTVEHAPMESAQQNPIARTAFKSSLCTTPSFNPKRHERRMHQSRPGSKREPHAATGGRQAGLRPCAKRRQFQMHKGFALIVRTYPR
jgi:hypothetical protein